MKIVLGTMTFGNQVDLNVATEMLNNFSSAGYTELDTAYVYNAGETEIMLGDISKDSPLENRFTVAGKANPKATGGLSKQGIDSQLDTSLERLNINKIDLFYLHSPDLQTPIEESLATINQAIEANKIGSFGLSNYAAWQVAEICEICKREGWQQPVCYQGMYNAITRDVEKELFLCLQYYQMAFYVYNPLAGGLLTGKYLDSTSLPTNGRFSYHKGYPERYWKDVNMQAVNTIAEACAEENIPLVNAALAWLIHHSPLANWQTDNTADIENAVVLGASSLAQLQQNLKACLQQPLPESVLQSIEKAWALAAPSCIKYFRP